MIQKQIITLFIWLMFEKKIKTSQINIIIFYYIHQFMKLISSAESILKYIYLVKENNGIYFKSSNGFYTWQFKTNGVKKKSVKNELSWYF